MGWWLSPVLLLFFLAEVGHVDGQGTAPVTDTEADPVCSCNSTTPTPTCTANDTTTDSDCGQFCNMSNKTANFYTAKPTDKVGVIKCEAPLPTTTVATKTTIRGGGVVVDDGNETEKNNTIITPPRCETGVLSGTKLLIAKIFSYLSFAWILICVLATIIANTKHKELATMCKATAIVIHIVIVILCASLVLEAIFADAMVHNKSFINGKIPPFLNYIIPIVIGLIPALVTYFVKKNDYLTGLHCFAEVPFEMFWGFVIPVWILLYIAGLKSSLGNLACDLTDGDVQDEDQIFWAKKTCKVLFFFSFNLLTCYLLCLFASSQQRFVIFIFFFLNTLIFGPIIFISHTYCHRNSQRKLYGKGMIGAFYKPCKQKHVPPPLPSPVAAVPAPVATKKKEKHTQTDKEPEAKPEEKKAEPEKAATPQPPKTDDRPSALPQENTPGQAQASPRRPSSAGTPPNWPNSREFYGWVGGKNKYDKSQDALFMPKPS
ncbi:hypothetical protein PRIPAC_96329 [Pristionchus pacificus]|uniref:Uncharacterized protein n=1 Tax=Pristionchus pacificus TaxID=54126 RepID=A0A2A6BCP1_PRIPA|nr:hypothetical protein PRIPAC_96329 [Pristionchus pacificus]|eukprot:PDM63616.1 hypothetical protein PRIPAC_49589 [Pristionchus pacificus]